MKRQKHLGVSAVMGKVYYGSVSKDGMGWNDDKVEVPKSEFVQAIFDWVKHASDGTNTVIITKIDSNGNQTPFAEIAIKYHKDYVNLCQSCAHSLPECEGNPVFGNGIGNDNVIKCDNYRPATEPVESL